MTQAVARDIITLGLQSAWIRLTNAEQIIAAVAMRNGLTVAEIKTRTPKHHIAHPRQEAMYELREHTSLSNLQIARKFGLTDHSTVVKGVAAHKLRAGL